MLHAHTYSRREFLEVAALGAGAFATACVKSSESPAQNIDDLTITARPGTPTATATAGFTALGLDTSRDGFLYVPPSYDAATPMPLLVLLHGGGHSSSEWKPQQSLFDELGLLAVAPDSRDAASWDLALTGLYGPDVAFIDSALARVFTQLNVDANHIGIAGFSDGAAEALGIGIANGDLFSTVVAFSPGALFGPFRRGEPSFFVSHGTEDQVIPFSRSSNQIVPALRTVFTDVTFVEFSGGHEVPTDIARQAYTKVKSG